MTTTAPLNYSVPGLERGLRLLSAFSSDNPTYTAPELERLLDIPRTTIFRLLVTLERLGFVERLPNGREYQLGTAVLTLGFEYLAALPLTQYGRPALAKLSQQLGYSCNLAVRDGRDIVYLVRSQAASLFTSSIHVGARLPAHATVLGRILLSHLSHAQLQALYPEETLPSHGAHTPQTVTGLHALISKDHERGYIIEDAFYEQAISTVATPVYGPGGKIIAALGVTIPGKQVPVAERTRLLSAVQNSARRLSEQLGAADRHP